jgi:hypothetical protein
MPRDRFSDINHLELRLDVEPLSKTRQRAVSTMAGAGALPWLCAPERGRVTISRPKHLDQLNRRITSGSFQYGLLTVSRA